MKFAFALLALLVSTSAFAAEKFVCTQYDRDENALLHYTVVLTPIETGAMKEGVKYKYLLERFYGAEVIENLSVKGSVKTEDVLFNFRSNDGKVLFHIYLDELNESGLTIDGVDAGDYVCR